MSSASGCVLFVGGWRVILCVVSTCVVTTLVPDRLSKDIVHKKALEDRDGVSFRGWGQICFLARMVKVISVSGTKVGQFCQEPTIRSEVF